MKKRASESQRRWEEIPSMRRFKGGGRGVYVPRKGTNNQKREIIKEAKNY